MKKNCSSKAKNSIIDVFDGSFKYDNNVLKQHKYYKQHKTCIKTLERIIVKDYNGIINSSDLGVVEAIDIDELEVFLKQGGDRKETCDTCIGISKRSNQKSPKILLIEFKLNLEKPNNQSSREIEGKINYSKQLIQNEYINIHNKTIIIIPDKNFEIDKGTLMRRLNNRKDVICHKIDDLRKIL